MTEYARKLIDKSEERARKGASPLSLERLAEIRAMSGGKRTKESAKPPSVLPDEDLWCRLSTGELRNIFDVEGLLADYERLKPDPFMSRIYRFTSSDLVSVSQLVYSERTTAKRSASETEATILRWRMRGIVDTLDVNAKTLSYWNDVIRRCDACALRITRLFDAGEYVADRNSSSLAKSVIPSILPSLSEPDDPPKPRVPAPPADQDIIDFNFNVLTLGDLGD